MQIRELTTTDAEAFRALRLQGFRDDPAWFGTTFEEASRQPVGHSTALLRREGRSPDDFVLGAFYAGTLVGIAGFSRDLRQKRSHRGQIWGMHVVPTARGMGVGRTLLNALVSRARTLPGLTRLNLSVMADNATAIQLYVRTGFEVWGREPGAVIHDGHARDELLMGINL
jgi:RimJ/RimL family protein N-acetyltransferase